MAKAARKGNGKGTGTKGKAGAGARQLPPKTTTPPVDNVNTPPDEVSTPPTPVVDNPETPVNTEPPVTPGDPGTGEPNGQPGEQPNDKQEKITVEDSEQEETDTPPQPDPPANPEPEPDPGPQFKERNSMTGIFSREEREYIELHLSARMDAGVTRDINHFIRQCVNFCINYTPGWQFGRANVNRQHFE